MVGTATELPLVSVVMVVRNEEPHLEDAIGSVLAQTYPGDRLEVIVVVGPSTDRTRAIADAVAARDPRIRVLDNPTGETPAGLNIGVRAARGDVYARLDGHSRLPDEFIERTVAVLADGRADGVGGRAEFRGVGTVGQAIALAMGAKLGGGPARFRTATAESPADTVANGVYPRAVFDDVGLFDESLLRNQDDEWHHRARRAGKRFVVTPVVSHSHVVRPSLRSLATQHYEWGVYRVATLAIHRRPGALRQLAPPALVAALAILGAVDVVRLSRGNGAGPPLSAVYPVAVGVAGAAVALRAGRPRLAPIVPLAMATMHLSYGCGFWSEGLRRAWRGVG